MYNEKMETTLYLYLLLYVIVLISISWIVSRKEGSEGFLIANRDRSWLTIAASKFAAGIGVGYFIAYTGYAYEYGLGVYLIILGVIVGYSLFGLWAAPRIHKNSHQLQFYTQGDFVKSVTRSRAAEITTNLFGNLILFGWLLVGVVGGAKIISHFGTISYELALILTVFIVVSYIAIAGFKAVLATDILQGVVILGLIGLLVWVMLSGAGAGFKEVLSASTGTIDIGTAVGFLIFGALSVFSLPNFYQLIYAGKDKKAVVVGLVSSLIPTIIVASLLLMVGMYMFTIDTTLDSGLVFLEALATSLPESLLPAGILLFFAGLMSSADTNIFSISSHYILSKSSPSNPIKAIRRSAFILGVFSIIFGLFFRDLVDITIIVAAANVILSPAMIYLIAGKKNAFRFLGSIWGGVIGLIIGLPIIGIEPTLILAVLLGNLLGFLYNGQFLQKHAGQNLEPSSV
jgi:solute:Na+ symporter, SSS family